MELFVASICAVVMIISVADVWAYIRIVNGVSDHSWNTWLMSRDRKIAHRPGGAIYVLVKRKLTTDGG